MKTILSKVKLKSRQIILLFVLVLLSAVGQMLLPSFLAQMISHGVDKGKTVSFGCMQQLWPASRFFPVLSVFYL